MTKEKKKATVSKKETITVESLLKEINKIKKDLNELSPRPQSLEINKKD